MATTVTWGLNGDAGKTNAGAYQWTCPAGVTSIDLEMIGSGGGGSGPNSSFGGGGGGRGGEYGKKTSLAVTPGTVYDLNVAAGGAAATGDMTDGSNGTQTWFIAVGTWSVRSGRFGISSPGGSAQANYVAGQSQSGTLTTSFNGGNGGAGSFPTGGNGGNGASSSANGTAAGGSTTIPGSGGRGCDYSSSNSTAGIKGQIKITYTAAAASGPITPLMAPPIPA